jgi:hypothetical protein
MMTVAQIVEVIEARTAQIQATNEIPNCASGCEETHVAPAMAVQGTKRPSATDKKRFRRDRLSKDLSNSVDCPASII